MGCRMSWIVALIVLSFTLSYHPSEAKKFMKKKLLTALVLGAVYCDTCSLNHFAKSSHFIPGASVAVECNITNPIFRKEVLTNKHGVFKVHLPLLFISHVKENQECSIKLISSNDPYCSIPSTENSTYPLPLNAKARIFSAGVFSFKPETQPDICEPEFQNINPTFSKPNSHHIDNLALFSPIPLLPKLPPLPQLPPMPTFPGLPLPQPLLPQPSIFSPLYPLPYPKPKPFVTQIPPYTPVLDATPPPALPGDEIPAFPYQPSPDLPGDDDDEPVQISDISIDKHP